MKIDDIPRLIGGNSSGVSLDLDYIKPLLERFSTTYGLDLDPHFQRGHVWSEANKVKFVEYVLRGGQVAPLRFNSPAFGGQSRSKNCDLPETVVLVDGKQRLNALMEFIDDKLAIFGGNYLSDFDNPSLLLRRAEVTYRVHTLQTEKEVCMWYLEMNEGHIAHTTEELDRVREFIAASKQ